MKKLPKKTTSKKNALGSANESDQVQAFEQVMVKMVREIMVKENLSDQLQTLLIPHIATAIEDLAGLIMFVVTKNRKKQVTHLFGSINPEMIAEIVFKNALKNKQVSDLQVNKQESIKEVDRLSKELTESKSVLTQLSFASLKMEKSGRSLISTFKDHVSHGAADDFNQTANICNEYINQADAFLDERKSINQMSGTTEKTTSPEPEKTKPATPLSDAERAKAIQNTFKGLGMIGKVIHELFGEKEKSKGQVKKSATKKRVAKKRK